MAMDAYERLAECVGFEWDDGNAERNRERHRVAVLANKRDVPYQSLIKVFLAERLDREMGKPAA